MSCYFVLERCNGRLIPSVQYCDSKRTRALMAEKPPRATRTKITDAQAFIGPRELMGLFKTAEDNRGMYAL